MPEQPEFRLVKASAGSGKTHSLTGKYIEAAFRAGSGPAPAEAGAAGRLGRILAVTFTKNAAREMKERILEWLRLAHLGDPEKIKELAGRMAVSEKAVPRRAGEAATEILAGYTDFQVETIDSFMASVFKASAVDLGFSPDFEIVLEPGELIDYAFFRYLREVREGSDDDRRFRTILDYLVEYPKGEAAYPWDPTPRILEKMTDFFGRLTSRTGELRADNRDKDRARIIKKIAEIAGRLEECIESSGLEKNVRGHAFSRILPAVKDRRFADLLACSFKTFPVKRPAAPKKGGADPASKPLAAACEKIEALWAALEKSVDDYGGLYARTFFYPYLLAYGAFARTLDVVKRRQGIVFIEDMNKQLAQYVDAGIVPDIYFRLGERILHFLIDEFQDTSPIQWRNLRPLIEESLSRGGSLAAVGDTKQAIYGFRDADYRIMKRLEDEEETFPSAELKIEELKLNWRSGEAIQEFVKSVFLRSARPGEDDAEEDEYARYAKLSGLNDFHQEVIDKHRGRGYVEYVLFDQSGKTGAEDRAEGTGGDAEEGEGAAVEPADLPEKRKLQAVVRNLRERGYRYSDIAVLTYQNKSVVQVSSWLNEIRVPFVPYSSLDIRGRRVIGEVLALLRFLDSPPDDLSFAAFILGGVFGRASQAPAAELRAFLLEARVARETPLYVAFRKRRPDLWERFFEPLFRMTGYYALYDLVTAVFRIFEVFDRFAGEEAALARLLEAIKAFEGQGRNDLREFLALAGDEGAGQGWTIDVPDNIDAVKVMTIHKAKGLGFRVVILLLYGERWMPPDFFIDAGGEGGDASGIQVLKITAGLADVDEGLGRVYEEAKEKDAVNRLNTLYVALTRAEAEMFVIGVKKRGFKFPFDRLEAAGSADADPAVEDRRIGGGTVIFKSSAALPAAWLKTSAAGAGENERAPAERQRQPFELPPNPREALNYAAVRRGELTHRILAEIEFVRSGWAEEIAAALGRVGPALGESGLLEDIGRSLQESLSVPPMAGFFEARPGRDVRREFSVCDAEGRSFRMDRVVIDETEVTVIDFKSGAEAKRKGAGRDAWDEEDRAQVRSYMALLRDLFPGRTVKGGLAHLDRRSWESVE